MKRNTLITAILLVLAAVVVAIVIGRGRSGDRDRASAADVPPPRNGGAETGDGFAGETTAKASPRTDRETSDRELVETYGDARTKLARNVSENVVGLLDDVISMGEMMMGNQGGGPWNRGEWQVRQLLRGTEIELTDAQREQAEQLLKEFRQRELERTKTAVGRLRDDPTPLMSLLLAGDARSREELGEDEYASLQKANAESLGDIINPLDRDNFRGGQPLEDEAFRSGFESILEPEQATAFREAQTAAEKPEESSQSDITQMPVMDLESAEQAIRSTRQMTAGFKQVMEGMGNLGPLLEEQRRSREGGE
jgi:hypothetical protein